MSSWKSSKGLLPWASLVSSRIEEASLKSMIVLWYECLDDPSYQGIRGTGEGEGWCCIVKFGLICHSQNSRNSRIFRWH